MRQETGSLAPQSLYRYAREPGALADVVVQLLEVGIERMPKILEASDVVARLESILAWMKEGPSSFAEGQQRGRPAAT
jgi:ATP-dependent Lon protease